MIHNQLLKNQRGYSLVSVLVGLALTALVSYGAALLLQETFKWNNNASAQSNMDRIHIILSQKARDSEKVASWLNLSADQKRCFSRIQNTDFNCQASIPQSYVELPATRVAYPEGGFYIVSSVFYAASCLYTTCQGINIKVLTRLTSDPNSDPNVAESHIDQVTTSTARETVYTLPSYDFGSKVNIKFDCSNMSGLRRVITGVETSWRDAKCDTLEYVDVCTAGQPMGQFVPSTVRGTPVKKSSCNPAIRAVDCTPSHKGYQKLGIVSSNCAP